MDERKIMRRGREEELPYIKSEVKTELSKKKKKKVK